MTTKTSGEILTVNLQVESATKRKRDTQNGEVTEWFIRAFIPDLGIKDYSTPFSIPVAATQDIMTGDKVRCKMRRGRLQSDRQGQLKSGQYDNQYFWDCAEWNTEAPVSAPAPSSSAAGPSPHGPAAGGIDQRIAWNSAINNATNLLAPKLETEVANDLVRELILDWAAWYYQAITSGPPQDVPAEALSVSVSVPAPPPEQAEPSLRTITETPAPPHQREETAPSAITDPWAYIAAALNDWNAQVKQTKQGRVLVWERDVLPRIQLRFGANPTPDQAATARAAIVQGSIATWPTAAGRA